MIHFSSHRSRAPRKFLALLSILCLLLPLMSGVVAAPVEDVLPVWDGGAAEAFNGSGIESDPYRISTPEELALLAQLVRAGDSFAGTYFLLTEDLALNDTKDFGDWASRPPARHWIPIGGYAAVAIDSAETFAKVAEESSGLYLRTEEGYLPTADYSAGVVYYRLTAFSGIFDGDGHTISGLYTQGETIYAGLFGVCRNAVLRNLNLTSAFVTGGEKIGLLCGALYADSNLLIDNCTAEGTLTATESGGGLIGYAEATGTGKLTVSASLFAGEASGNTAIGGILGESGAGGGSLQLAACENRGQITADSSVGGILGELDGEADQILSCKNQGAIFGQEHAGGIIGKVSPAGGIATISDSQNGGTILSGNTVGGIAGSAETPGNGCSIEFLSCRNVGELHGETSVGGILGYGASTGEEDSIRLMSCKNSAAVNGQEKVGGILGAANSIAGSLTASGCENYGNITANGSHAGGILGYGEASARLTLSQGSVRASVTAAGNAGGIAGTLIASTGTILVEQSAAGGTVKATASPENTDSTLSPAVANGTAGGIAGVLRADENSGLAEIKDCFSAVTLTAVEAAGGMAGTLSAISGTSRISTSLFAGGIVSGCKLTGGIAATSYGENEGATAEILDCYFSQSASSRATLPSGGKGSEICTATEALSEESLRTPEQLPGLDFETRWQEGEANHFPTPRDLPFVWEEYQYTVTQNGAILLAYLGRSDIARVPDKLGGVAVTTLSEDAFWQSGVIRVVLPDTITAIGEAAFAGCTQLERITLPASLISIGARAFNGCTSLSELRCSGSLSTLVVGSENEPFQALTITRPVTIQASHSYEDGSLAGKSTSLSCYIGDYYQIAPLSITGYEADRTLLSGTCRDAARITVIYRLGTYHLTIRYLYPDGREAFPSFEGDFSFGEAYSITTPSLEGYKADRSLLEGKMEGSDTQLTVYFNEVFDTGETGSGKTLQIALLILSGLIMVCCLVYFIYRYRSAAEKARVEADWVLRR